MDIYNYDDLINWLNEFIKSQSQTRGIKTSIASSMSIQPAYLSNVLNGKAKINLDQALGFAHVFRLSSDETDYLILLVEKDRSASVKTKEHFQNKILETQKNKKQITQKLEGPSTIINEAQQALYYSSWIYAAVQVALTIPNLQTTEKIQNHFKITAEQAENILNDLEKMGLVQKKLGKYKTTEWIKLGQDSRNLVKHHNNFRQKAIQDIDLKFKEDLHFTACYSLSKEDAEEIKKSLQQKISEISKKIRTSDEEVLYSFNLDFWKI